MFLPHNIHNIANARQLRKNMTAEERHLWYDFLRPYPVKIKKQRPIGNYIVDFFCESAKLVIELDGSQHFETNGLEADEKRTAYLENLGLMIVRYSNSEINQEFQTVCEDLDRLIQERSKLQDFLSPLRPGSQTGAPPPQGEAKGGQNHSSPN